MNTRLQNKIEEYHSGRMSSEQVNLFESELASDPSLQAESDFQGDIINGLKEYRKSELKTRLNTVEIGPAWLEFVQQSTLLKSFGGVAVATLVGTGVYLMAEPDKEADKNGDIVIDAPLVTQNMLWDIKPAELRPTAKPVEVSTFAASEDTPEVSDLSTNNNSKEEVSDNAGNPALLLDFRAPLAEEIADEEALEANSLDALPETTVNEEAVAPIDVDHEVTSALNIKYKYYDGKLFLSGDFDRAPYEILEINSANGRRIYVKYLEKYYKVGITDRLTTLPVVQDVQIIRELQLLRENK